MTSSSSSSFSVPPRASLTPAASPSSARKHHHHPPPSSSPVLAGAPQLEQATSSTTQSLFVKYPIGSTLIAQANPRLHAIVVGHHTTAAGSPLLSLFQTGYYDRCTQEWVPPKLRYRYINRLPQQQSPPDHIFEDPGYVQQQILRMVKEDPGKEFTEPDFDALIHQLSAQAPLPPPPPIFLNTSSEIGGSSARPFALQPHQPLPQTSPPFSHSQRHTVNSAPKVSQQVPLHYTSLQPPLPDLTRTVEALAKRLENIDIYVRSQNSGSHHPPKASTHPPAPISHHSHTPTIPGLPTAHPQLLVDTSPRISPHSRSHSRSRSRERHASVRPYTNVYVPCPFHDNGQAMTPAAGAKGATRAAKDIFITSRPRKRLIF